MSWKSDLEDISAGLLGIFAKAKEAKDAGTLSEYLEELDRKEEQAYQEVVRKYGKPISNDPRVQ